MSRFIQRLRAVRFVVLSILLFAAASTGVATAATWPTKPVTLMVGFTPGGAADMLARLVAKALETELGQPVVVRNAVGGGGIVMATGLSRSKPDGYTIGLAINPTFDALPYLTKLAYKPDDFVYLTTITQLQNALVTSADAPFSTWEEMVAYAKDKDGLNYGSASPITAKFIELVTATEDVKFRIVPMPGGQDIVTNLLGGHIDIGWSAGVHQNFEKDLKVIVSLNNERLATSPDSPSIAEIGYEFGYDTYFLVAAPKGLPDDVRNRLSAALNKASSSPEVVNLAEQRMKFPSVVLGTDELQDLVMKQAEINKQRYAPNE